MVCGAGRSLAGLKRYTVWAGYVAQASGRMAIPKTGRVGMKTEDAYWLYKNDVGDPVPYVRVHNEHCPAAAELQRRIFYGEKLHNNRWIGPHDTCGEAINVARRIMANVLLCRQCEWRYPKQENR